MDRHPKGLTARWHGAAQEQEQGQRRQQPHPHHPPRAVPGLLYSQPLAPGGISQPPLGLGRPEEGEDKGTAPRLNFPAIASPCYMWPALPPCHKKEKMPRPPPQTGRGFGQRLLRPVPPTPSTPNPGMPCEGRQGTVTEGCHLYWVCWVVPKRDSQQMVMGWERLEAGMGIFKGLKALKGAQAAACFPLDWGKATAGWGREAVLGPAHLAMAASSAGSLFLPPAKSRRGRNV